jgi:KaiC/GvpD/RAD55 family RecA-like ATPase
MKFFSEVKNRMVGAGVYKTGWSDLNDMLQGGFRPGEFVMIPALQHKYKTGFTLSLFAQIATWGMPGIVL